MRECVACGQMIPDVAAACPNCWTLVIPIVEKEQVFGLDEVETKRIRVGDILYSSIKLCRSDPTAFLRRVVPIIVPTQCLGALIRALGPAEADVVIQGSLRSPFTPPSTLDMSALRAQLVGRLLIVFLNHVALLLAMGASLPAVGAAYMPDGADSRKILSFDVRRSRPLVWLAIVPTLLIGVGAILGLLPAIFLYTSWSVAIPVLVLERKRGGSALRRSAKLVRGHRWSVLGVLLVVQFITLLFWLIFGSTLRLALSFAGHSSFGAFGVDALASSVTATLVTPFVIAALVTIYLDLRMREIGMRIGRTSKRSTGSVRQGESVERRKAGAGRPKGASSRRASVKPRPAKTRKPKPPTAGTS